MQPLDRFGSVKLKLSAVIVASTLISSTAASLGAGLTIPGPLLPVLAAVVGLVLVSFFSRGITSPLREMAHASRQMAAGNYGIEVRATSRDEVGDLARAFNRMAGELATVDRQRRDLVANVSHELRTPLTALQANLENLVDGVSEPAPEMLEAMLAQTHRLGRLVEQLLDLSRLESGASPLDVGVVPIKVLLERVVGEARMQQPDAQLHTSVEPADLAVRGDDERLHQVLANLIENSFRHAPGAAIEVRATADSDRVRVVVADDGPGIAVDQVERVFERFHRADQARSAGGGGAGLGLSIARWIVDLHGGSVRAENGARGGVRIVIDLPSA